MVKPVGEAELELTVSMLQMQRSPNPCKTSCIRFSRLFPHSLMERRTAKRYKAEFVYVETLHSAARGDPEQTTFLSYFSLLFPCVS